MQTLAQRLAEELGQNETYVQNVIDLIDEGNTIPFIARYRKELHGAMDDTTLRTLSERLSYLRSLEQRKQEVKKAISEQGKLTGELEKAIDSAAILSEVEDLYRPYKQKRRTRATIAREKGLEPLAVKLFMQVKNAQTPEVLAASYLNPEQGVETVEDALQGAIDIIAERLSDDADIRKELRALYLRRAVLVSQAAAREPEDTVYRLYYDFKCPVNRIQGYQVLAINRGEREDVLKVAVELDPETAHVAVRRLAVPGAAAMEFVRSAADDAYDRLIQPPDKRT